MTAITSLVVQVKTKKVTNAQTDDAIYFDIGPREWYLDNKAKNDFEKGKTDTFVLKNLTGLQKSDIRRIRLQKYGTNGWLPQWIKVWVNQPLKTGTPYYSGNIDMWLDGGAGAENTYGLVWQAPDFPCQYPIKSDQVTSLIVKVTTGTKSNAQTDDEVYFSVGTREWYLDNKKHNDFEAGHTDSFDLKALGNLSVGDIREIGLRKTGTNGWFPSRIRVWVNDTSTSGTPLADSKIDMWLDGGGGAEQKFGLKWTDPNYPQQTPEYSQLDSQPNINVSPKVTSLIVVVKTKNDTHADTDDGVYFDIGTREWYLDNKGHDDFERAQTDTFVLSQFGNLRISDIRKIALRKTGTNGWRPGSIKVYVNDPGKTTPFYSGKVDTWLDGGAGAENEYGLRWEANDFYHEVPIKCWWVVGATTSTIRPARSKQASAELIRNLNTASYRMNGNSSNAIWTAGRVKYVVTGFGTVTVPDADAQVMPDSTSAERTDMGDIAIANNQADRLNIYFVRATATGSNWKLTRSGVSSCWVQDTRGGNTVNTNGNFRAVAVSCAHEIGHFLGLPHMCNDTGCSSSDRKFLMYGNGTNATSQLLSKSEANTAHSGAASLADWERNVC